jgi:ABC-type multidrug transport system fused ATPase/permease subunit
MTGPIYGREADPEKLLQLPIEEIAPYLLDYLRHIGTSPFSEKNVFLEDKPAADYPPPYRDRVSLRLMEVFKFLERVGLIIQSPGSDPGWYRFSEQAVRLADAPAVKQYLDERLREPSTRYTKSNEELDRKLAEITKQIATRREEAITFIEEHERSARERISKTARKVSVHEAQQQFDEAQRTHTKRIKWWGTLSALSMVMFLTVAWSFAIGPPPSTGTAVAIYHVAIRITVLTALAAVATFCLRVLRAHMHMREVSLHRQRIANSMAAFVEAAATDEQGDAVFSRMVDSVVGFGASGLILESDEQVLPAKLAVDSIIRTIQSKQT